ncbi:hypothetical protein MMC13_006855 [Lambiella insularis]|nr:hypothetical protein [Lambiella insularis]
MKSMYRVPISKLDDDRRAFFVELSRKGEQSVHFLIWQLRTAYLTHIKDGVGERLINVDSGILNDPSFRAAGWTTNIADIKRCYSPPIPTAITSDYFSAPIRSAGFATTDLAEDDEEGGMVTGRGSCETVGPGPVLKRRRRREQQEEDDSSDLSDESDEDAEGAQRAAQQIKFAKMPVRNRAGSSPIRSLSIKDGPEVLITSPSRRSTEGRFQRGSLGAVGAVKQRARRDTVTSSEMSSENELDPSLFQRRQIPAPRSSVNRKLLHAQHEENEDEDEYVGEEIRETSGDESDETSLSSEFGEAADSESLLGDMHNPLTSTTPPMFPSTVTVNPPSPRKTRGAQGNALPALPPSRPISTVQPISALGQAIRARQAKPRNPIELFARLSGKGALNPLSIRIYAPFSETSEQPFDMPLQRTTKDSDTGDTPQVTVADAIGLSLWRYHEEGLKPPIPRDKLDVNRWTLRIVDDGEVEYDFPALNRTSAMVDFTSNNNRPARGRSRAKAYDEFALVEATQAQYQENRNLTPKYSKQFNEVVERPSDSMPQAPEEPNSDAQDTDDSPINPAINKPFAFATRKQSATLADRPAITTVHSTPRTGPPKMLKIHFTSLEAYTQTNIVEVTTDTYIAEVLDIVCKKWNLDKTHHFLKVTGTNTIAPLDRTVEAIGARTDLDLIRRRFAYDGAIGLTGSPGSSSPNAPLLLNAEMAKKGKKGTAVAHPLAQKQDLWTGTGNYKRYTVVRKQPMSFTPSHQRTLLMDGDYMHILPGETGKTLFDTSAKSTTVPFSMIVGCKVSRRHPKTFRVIIFRERETKRYDFEAQSISDAAEIVQEIRKGMEPFHPQLEGV